MLLLYLWPTLHHAFQCILASLVAWMVFSPFLTPHISFCISSSEVSSPTSPSSGLLDSLSHLSPLKQVPKIPAVGRDINSLRLLLSSSAKGVRLASSSKTHAGQCVCLRPLFHHQYVS